MQDAFCILQSPRCFMRCVGIIPADAEAETEATHTWGLGTWTQTYLSHHHPATTEFHLWPEKKKNHTLKINLNVTQPGEELKEDDILLGIYVYNLY